MSQVQEVFLFNPTSVSGCQLWLDGADPNATGVSPANGTSISTWTDKSGNGRNAVNQATSAILYTNVQNTLSVLRFVGTENYSITYSSFPNTAYTIFTLQYLSNNNSSYRRVIHAPTGGDAAIFVGVLGQNVATFTGNAIATWNDITANSPNSNNLNAWRIVDTWVSGSTLTPYVDGTAQTNKTGTTGAFSNLSISVNGQSWVGDVAEILVFNSALNTIQRQQIEGYLAWKWGLQGNLPSDHPYKNQRPLAGGTFPKIGLPRQPIVNQNMAVFTPTQISGCQLWLDATDPYGTGVVPANGAAITQWKDKSSNGFSGTQVNSPTFQTGVQNNLPIIRFNGTNQYINFGNVLNLGTNRLSIFTVTKFVQPAAISGYGAGIVAKSYYGAQEGRWAMGYDGYWSSGMYSFVVDGTNAQTTFSFNPSTQYNIFSSVNNRTSYNEIYANGTLGARVTFTQAVNSLSTSDSLFVAVYNDETGVAPKSTQYLNGDIAEIIVYFTELSTSQRQQVEGYLAWKWGLVSSLPNGHPYKQIPIAPFPAVVTPVRGSLNQWIPTQISGCSLWLDAADTTTLSLSGSSITQWRDKSGNSRNATGTGTPTLTQTIQNKLSAIYFNGTSYFTGSLTNTTNQQSFFSVFRYNTGAPQYARLASFGVNGQFDYNNNAYYNMSYNTGTLAITRSPTETQVTLASPALDAFHQASVLFDGTNGLYYTDGGSYSNSAAWTANFNFSQYRLGSDQIPFVPQEMIGYIGEVIVYSSGISVKQRQQVEGYLAWKWGLQGNLPSSHPYKKWPPSP